MKTTYKCKWNCGFEDCTLSKVIEHQKAMHMVKKKCGVCDKTFDYDRDLNKHLRSQHNIKRKSKPYSGVFHCRQCIPNIEFKKRSDLVAHQQEVHVGISYFTEFSNNSPTVVFQKIMSFLNIYDYINVALTSKHFTNYLFSYEMYSDYLSGIMSYIPKKVEDSKVVKLKQRLLELNLKINRTIQQKSNSFKTEWYIHNDPIDSIHIANYIRVKGKRIPYSHESRVKLFVTPITGRVVLSAHPPQDVTTSKSGNKTIFKGPMQSLIFVFQTIYVA